MVQEIKVEAVDQTSCLQIRENLDALFYGDSRLEAEHTDGKRRLFRHLESCDQCCRVFDVRIRFRSSGRPGIL